MNRIVLITGASRGLGFAMAETFAASGDFVVLCGGHDREALDWAYRELKSRGAQCAAYLADVSDYAQAEDLFRKIREEWGEVEVLINNAGIAHRGLFQDMTPPQWQKILDTNLGGVLNCTHLAVPAMVAAHKGVILNISSIWGAEGASCEAVYSASKGGVESFTRAMAKELGPSGIRVNAIAFGAMATEMNSSLTMEEKEAFCEGISLGRFGYPHEGAELARFLCSPMASYMNGQVVTLDGGRY